MQENLRDTLTDETIVPDPQLAALAIVSASEAFLAYVNASTGTTAELLEQEIRLQKAYLTNLDSR